MLFFPQLNSGSVAQYPLRSTLRQRAVVNDGLGGERFTSYDASAGEWEWDLNYRGLTREEAGRLSDLFEACEGRRGVFTFADPAANLLARSGEFDQAPWQSDALLNWTSGVNDPLGGTAAMRAQNASGVAQNFRQSVALPAGYELCFSIWLYSLANTEVVVRRTSGAESMSTAIPFVGGEWRRIETAAALEGEGESVQFALEIPGAAAVDFFGAQVEAQRHASGYRHTLARSGVHTEARFGQDDLVIEADGYQSFATRLRIVAPL